MPLASIIFSLVAAAAVWSAGRRDAARDPRLTLLALALLACFPLLALLPKAPLLPAAEVRETPDFLRWLPWVWGAGVAVFSLRLVAALAAMVGWRRHSRLLERREGVEIRELDGLAGPVAAGILRPAVFVPGTWRDWSAPVRAAVLAHEIKHHHRRDPLWRAVGAAACTLHWFNPLVWWMARRLADQCEFACDAAVLADGMEAECYAHVLCDLAASTRSPATALAMAHESGLEARVRRIFSSRPAGSGRFLAALLLLTLATALGLVLLKPADPPAAPAVPMEEIRTRFDADPFPGN